MHRLMLIGAIAFLLVLLPSVVEAHVLIKDQSGTSGAILHVVPDDDPIAGKKTDLIFDVQNSTFIKSGFSAELQITQKRNGQTVTVPTITKDNIIRAAYVFPVQGAYDIKLTIAPGQNEQVFNYSQRVSRGVAGSVAQQPRFVWAEIGFISSVCGLLILAIIAVNRIREIRIHSKF